MYDLNRENVDYMALATITDIWSGIDWEKVDGKRAMGIWDEYISKIKASAMTTNSYEKFVEKLCRKMEVRSLRYSNVSLISNQTDEFKIAILKTLRENTQVLVLKLRLNNQVMKEEAKKNQELKEKYDLIQNKLDNTKVKFIDKGVNVDEK